MSKRILIVEDEKNIVDILSFNLSKEGYDTLEAYDGQAGLQLALEQDPDLVLLDLMLPKMDGFDVCRQLRQAGRNTPVIMLTAREEETDKVLGLELGADDYITKPFSMRELLARIRANIRRASQYDCPSSASSAGPELLTAGKLVMNLSDYSLTKNGQPIELTAKEFEILKLLLRNPKKVYTKEQLYSLVWQDAYCGDENAVNVHISRLRSKIEDNPRSPRYILTVWGIGYKLGERL